MNASPTTSVRYRIENIPDELKQFSRWVTFQIVKDATGKTRKLPLIPGKTGKHPAKADDPKTWRSFAEAHRDAEVRGLFLAFVFGPDIPYVFIDYDDIEHDEGDRLRDDIALVVDTLDTYTEWSQSGNGLHIISRGTFPPNPTRTAPEGHKPPELYPRRGGRFCVFTGDVMAGHETIEERSRKLAALFPPRPAKSLNGTHPEARSGGTLTTNEIQALVAWAKRLWVDGRRHHMALHLSGELARQGVSREQAAAIVERCAADDADPAAKITACHDTYDAKEAGETISGWHGLRDVCGLTDDELGPLTAVLDGFWQRGKAAMTRTANVKPAEEPSAWAEWPDPPAEATYGWFRDYLALMEPTTEAPAAFHLASALTVAGAAIGKRVRTEYASEPLFANLYTVLIGPSGSSRKDTAIKRALSLSWPPSWERTVTSLPYQTVTDVSSAEGLIKTLKREPNTLLYLTELSNLMRNARRKGTSTILPRLIEAFDTPAKMANLSKGDPEEVADPYLSILAATQPGILATEMSVEDIHSGFANRWLFVPGDRRERKPTPPKLDKSASWALWRDLNDAVLSYGPGTALHEANDVQAMWDVWYLKERSRSEEEGSLSVRHPVLVRKIALILAVTDRSKRIELVHVQTAIVFVDWMWEQTRRLMADWGVGKENKLYERVMRALERHGAMKRRTLWPKVKDRQWNYNDFARLIDNMIRQGTIALDGDGNIGIPVDE